MSERPRNCPDCGDEGLSAHTGTYCQACGYVLTVADYEPEMYDGRDGSIEDPEQEKQDA